MKAKGVVAFSEEGYRSNVFPSDCILSLSQLLDSEQGSTQHLMMPVRNSIFLRQMAVTQAKQALEKFSFFDEFSPMG